MTVVSIVQRRLTNYRVPLFNLLRDRLATEQIELRLIYGQGTTEEALKRDSGELPWGIAVGNRYLLGDRISWQPYLPYTEGSALIVMPHENKQVENFLAMLKHRHRGPRIGFWGHGKNMQSGNSESISERVKRWSLRRVDWWFAYTEMSAEFVVEAGFPRERTTVLNNSIDTRDLQLQIAQVGQLDGLGQRRRSFGLGDGPVGLFIGSLYSDKRLPFLIEAAVSVRREVPDFELVIAGAGDDLQIVEDAVRNHKFIKYVGMVSGEQKARLLSCANLVLNPGLVGLAILDAFVAGLPMFTTDCGIHSPEIAYLLSGTNGVMTADNQNAYVNAVVTCLRQPDRLARLGDGALTSAQRFSIEKMAENFCAGIVACLAASKLRAR